MVSVMSNPNQFLMFGFILLIDLFSFADSIKRVCETELGIVSQCVQPRQAVKMQKQYLENLSLKINVKVQVIINSLLVLSNLFDLIASQFLTY